MQIYSDQKSILKRRRTLRIKLYFLLFFLAVLFLEIFYLAVYSNIFKMRSVSVENNKFLQEGDVMRIIKPVILSGKFGGLAGLENMLSWPSGKVSVSDPDVSYINIKKNWFQRTIDVEVNERQRFAIWCLASSSDPEKNSSGASIQTDLSQTDSLAGQAGRDGQSCYWIDKEGTVFSEAPSTEGSMVSVIFDSRLGVLALGSRVEEDRFVGNLISILENLNMLDLEINRIDFNDELQELTVSTTDGPTIMFGLRYDSAKNIPLIKNLDYKNLKYIDLRVENRIFIPAK